MSMMDKIKGLFTYNDDLSGGTQASKHQGLINDVCRNRGTSSYKTLAIQSAWSLIANAVCSSSIDTYHNRKKYNGDMYYLFNVAPNQNQNAAEFKQQLLRKLLEEGDALVIMLDEFSTSSKGLYVADGFYRNTEQKYPTMQRHTYTGVCIDGFVYNRTFFEDEVLYLKLPNHSQLANLSALYREHSKLANAAATFYKTKNVRRYQTTDPYLTSQTVTDYIDRLDIMYDQMDDFIDPDVTFAVRLNQKDQNLEDISDNTAKSATTRDYADLIDDFTNYVAMALNVPVNLLKGDSTNLDANMDTFITTTIAPLCQMLEDEINRKLYGKDDYLNGTKCRINTSTVKVTTDTGKASNYEVLLRSGAWTINDIRRDMDMTELDPSIGDVHYVTKNYGATDDTGA